ncbi:MAG: phage holin [Solobacterium sp.]|jgi:hypothetical protein|nr:phage holin [Solobacterium sp.]MCH4226793.1 phage holin [Solobacterium sp.]MCH4281878.1 phage holin [Solobacterium sp.]
MLKLKLSNDLYDLFKFIAQIVLPALGAFYAALAGIWGLPYAVEITGTLAAVDTFLGALLQISTSNYNKVDDTEVKSNDSSND